MNDAVDVVPGCVFISYAHQDRRWLDELTTHLKPWERALDRRLAVWSDTSLSPGEAWKQQIERAIEASAVCVLLVTPAFLASDFIYREELPKILERFDRGETALVWVAAEPAAVETTKLATYQAANDPSRPLVSLGRPERQRILVEIAKKVADAAALGTLATSLSIVDETYEPLAALAEGRQERDDRSYRVVADFSASTQEISFSGGYRSIRREDLVNLAPDDHEFVQDLEKSLRSSYAQWRDARGRLRADRPEAAATEDQAELRRIQRLICADLSDILDFLRKIYRYELEDHYGRYRYLCSQLDD